MDKAREGREGKVTGAGGGCTEAAQVLSTWVIGSQVRGHARHAQGGDTDLAHLASFSSPGVDDSSHNALLGSSHVTSLFIGALPVPRFT